MTNKSQQLQIRVTPHQKNALKRLASAAGLDVSSYVLARALPPVRLRFETILNRLRDEQDRSYALAELNDLLSGLGSGELIDAVAQPHLEHLSPFSSNYLAAMVEQACHLKRIPPPSWTARIEPLERPYFGAPLASLRLHLLRASPVPFKRRNLFVDSTIGDRV